MHHEQAIGSSAQAEHYARQRISAFPIEIREQDNLSVHSVDDRSSSVHEQPLPAASPYDPQPQIEEKKQNKKRLAPSILTDEQKQMVAEEMSDANLGLLCNVCGKIFKSRDALDFHIMYTKLPGHDVVQQQRVKNNYAQEAMRISSKLSSESHLPPDYGPPTPVINYEQQPPAPAAVPRAPRRSRGSGSVV